MTVVTTFPLGTDTLALTNEQRRMAGWRERDDLEEYRGPQTLPSQTRGRTVSKESERRLARAGAAIGKVTLKNEYDEELEVVGDDMAQPYDPERRGETTE